MLPQMNHSPHSPDDTDGDLAVAPAEPKLRRPSLWQVVILNDDFTPMEFVVRVLMEIFEMPPPYAMVIMFSIHEKGQGIAGIYSREIAESKKAEMESQARAEGHQLSAVLQRVPGSDSNPND